RPVLSFVDPHHCPPLRPCIPYRLRVFFFKRSLPHQALHSFPTRRSSDLRALDAPVADIDVDGVRDIFVSDRLRFASTWRTLDYQDRKSTRLNSSHVEISYAVFCLKKKKQ